MDIENLAKIMVQKNASDLFITVGAPPSIAVNGEIQSIVKSDFKLNAEQVTALIRGSMTEPQFEQFQKQHEANFALRMPGIGRFRASAFFQQTFPGMVLREIKTNIPSIDTLALPAVLKKIALAKRGLVIFVGATGSGKSTTLAATVDHRNANSHEHIVTIEDPIEFIHRHKKCIITQREVGTDTQSIDIALKNTLRQAPNVIVIGEVRTAKAMEYALTFAETGHLCLLTLHANNANQALDRIIHFFPSTQHEQIWMDLSLNLRAVVAQQLIRTKDKKRRVPATEILLNTPSVSQAIINKDIEKIKEIMKNSTQEAMQTFDYSLYDLYKNNLIEYEDALKHADAPNDLRILIKVGLEMDPDKLKKEAQTIRLDEEDTHI